MRNVKQLILLFLSKLVAFYLNYEECKADDKGAIEEMFNKFYINYS